MTTLPATDGVERTTVAVAAVGAILIPLPATTTGVGTVTVETVAEAAIPVS